MNLLENKGISEIKKLCGKHGISTIELSAHIGVVSIRVYEILHGKRRITADSDLRLCRFFNLGDGHFLRLQEEYDLALAKIKIQDKLSKIKPVDKIVKKEKGKA